MGNYIISKSVFTSADGKETREVTVYTDRVEMTGDGLASPMVMNGKPLADVRDEMASLVNYLITHKGWTKDESESTDNIPEIETLLANTVSRWQGKVHGSDDRYYVDVVFPEIRNAALFVGEFELEWNTTFRSRDGIDKFNPFAKQVIIQFPIHRWYQTAEKVREDMED